MSKIFKRFVFSFIFEWEQLIPRFNWYTVTPIEIQFEYDKMMQGLEFMIIIIGIGIRIRYNLPASDKIFKKIEKEVSSFEIKKDIN